MKKRIIRVIKAVLILYVLMCVIMFFVQEKMIFHPQKLEKDYKFSFEQTFEEINVKVDKDISLNGLLFKADSSKGLIFHLHGNAGSLKTWGGIADTYTNENYDLFILDYRGFGKSEGKIRGQKQLFSDVQKAYDKMKKRYDEDSIIVIGYSIGSGIAANLASKNKPKLLILEAPYFSLVDMMRHDYPFVPAFLLKYKIETNLYVKDCSMPIVIFHGDKDEAIPYESSTMLKKVIKPSDTLITLKGQGHNGISDNPDYVEELRKILKD